MADSVGMLDLRAEDVDAIVKGFALEEYKMMQVCSVVQTSAWTQTYYTETAAELTGGLGSNVKGVPRLANFPYGEVTWTEVNERLVKHGMDGVVSWEDAKTDAIDTVARTLLRISRAVAYSVDRAIETEIATTTNTAAAVANWDAAVVADRDPIQDILKGIQAIQEYNFDPYKNGYLLLSPKDFRNLLMNQSVRNAGQFYTSDVTKNGRVGRILGLTIVVSNAVTADQAYIVCGGEAMTWYEASPLKTHVIEDPGIKYTIRAWQVGVPVLINNYAAYKITNTQL